MREHGELKLFFQRNAKSKDRQTLNKSEKRNGYRYRGEHSSFQVNNELKLTRMLSGKSGLEKKRRFVKCIKTCPFLHFKDGKSIITTAFRLLKVHFQINFGVFEFSSVSSVQCLAQSPTKIRGFAWIRLQVCVILPF